MEQASNICMAFGVQVFQMHIDFFGAWTFTICVGPLRF